ncbi:DUF389 domain-containing protein [Halotia wernerae UHCC 0503]|nr:DUF389 domain-containing protein [Halotia wernerae UHCC 0503]
MGDRRLVPLREARVRERLGFPPQSPQRGGTFWEEVSPQKLPWEPAQGAALQVEQLRGAGGKRLSITQNISLVREPSLGNMRWLAERGNMRQLIIQVSKGHGKAVLDLAKSHGGRNLAQIERSQISAIAVLLPLAAGAAGALNLVQSERSSLVSGAATGMLVAASLAPPSGIVGMASAIGRWDMVTSGLFLLLLQLCGINLSAAFLFRIYGLSTQGTRYQRGKKWVFFSALTTTIITLCGLLTWQFANSPNLERSSIAQRANSEVQKVVKQEGLAQLVESNVRFTRSDIKRQNTLLCVVYVQRNQGVAKSDQEISDRLTRAIQNRLIKQGFNLTPLIDIKVLETPVQN